MASPFRKTECMSILNYCLICGIKEQDSTRRFELIGKKAKDEGHQNAPVWMKEYIGIEVNQAKLCSLCYGLLESVENNVKQIRETCLKTVESLGISSGLGKNDHSYSATRTGAKLNISIPEGAQTASPIKTSSVGASADNENDDDDYEDINDKDCSEHMSRDSEGSSNVTEKSLPCTFCNEVFSDQKNFNVHIKSHDLHMVQQGKDYKPIETKTASSPLKPSRDTSSLPLMLFKHVPNTSGPVTRGKSGALARQVKVILPKVEHTSSVNHKETAKLSSNDQQPVKPVTSAKTSLKIYKCKICHAEFKSSLFCSRHQETHDKYYTEKVTVDETSGNEEATTEKASDPFQCKICGEEFPNKYIAAKHMRSHTEKTPYKCRICDKKLATKSSMRIHLLTHASDKAFTCEHCSKKFGTRGAYNRHLKTHNSKSHLCNECGKMFATKDTLKQHTDSIHNEDYVKSHICDICGKRFDRGSKLSVHKASHTSDRNHLCDMCGKTFKQLSVLKTHRKLSCASNLEKDLKKAGQEIPKGRLRAPKTPRPHRCTACPYRFKSVAALADHVTLSHEKECILCGVPIYSGQALKAHKAVCKLGELSKEEVESNSQKKDNTESTTASSASISVPNNKNSGGPAPDTTSTSTCSVGSHDSTSTPIETTPGSQCSATVSVPNEASVPMEQSDSTPSVLVEAGVPMEQCDDATNTAVEAFLHSFAKVEPNAVTDNSAVILSEENITPGVSQMEIVTVQDLNTTNPISLSTATPMIVDSELVENYHTTTLSGAEIGMEGETIVFVLDSDTDPSQAGVALTDTVSTLPVHSPAYFNISKQNLL